MAVHVVGNREWNREICTSDRSMISARLIEAGRAYVLRSPSRRSPDGIIESSLSSWSAIYMGGWRIALLGRTQRDTKSNVMNTPRHSSRNVYLLPPPFPPRSPELHGTKVIFRCISILMHVQAHKLSRIESIVSRRRKGPGFNLKLGRTREKKGETKKIAESQDR